MRGENQSYDPDNPDENFDPNDPNGYDNDGNSYKNRHNHSNRNGGSRGNKDGPGTSGRRRGGRSQGGARQGQGPPESKQWQQGPGGSKGPYPPGSKQWGRGPQGSNAYPPGYKGGGGSHGSQVKKRTGVRSKSAGRARENLAVLHTNHPRQGKATNLGQGHSVHRGQGDSNNGYILCDPHPPGSTPGGGVGYWTEVGQGRSGIHGEGAWNPNLPPHLRGEGYDDDVSGRDHPISAWAEVIPVYCYCMHATLCKHLGNISLIIRNHREFISTMNF